MDIGEGVEEEEVSWSLATISSSVADLDPSNPDPAFQVNPDPGRSLATVSRNATNLGEGVEEEEECWSLAAVSIGMPPTWLPTIAHQPNRGSTNLVA